MPDQLKTLRFLRLRQVKDRTGLSSSSIYDRMAQGTFPKTISLGGTSVGWIEAEIDDWMRGQIERSRRQVA